MNQHIGCYYELYIDYHFNGCPGHTVYDPEENHTPLCVIRKCRLEFIRAIWEAEGDCELLTLTGKETFATSVLQKAHVKHTINFLIPDVTFYCPIVSGPPELAGSPALLSRAR